MRLEEMDIKMAVFTVSHIVEKQMPILYVVHDADGDLQFLPGIEVSVADIKIVGLDTIFRTDPSIAQLELEAGYEASRSSADAAWEIYKIEN